MKSAQKSPRRLRFSSRVMIYLLIAYALMAVLFGGMYFINARRSTENRVIEEIAHSVDRTRAELDNLFAQAEGVYLSLLFEDELYDLLVYEVRDRAAPLSAQLNADLNDALRKAIRNLDDILSVQLLNDSYVFTTWNTTYTSVTNVGRSPLYQRARQNSQAFWAPTYDFTLEYGHALLEDKSLPINHRYLVSYVGRLNAFKLAKGSLEIWPARLEKPVIFVNISANTLGNLLGEILGSRDGECFIVDDGGSFVAHTDATQLCAPMASDGFELLSAQASPSGVLSTRYGGRDSLMYYARLSNGWTLVTALGRREVFADIYGVIWSTLLGMLLGTLVLSVLLALLVSRTLSLPIKQLLQAINITAGGNFMVNLPRTGDEFDAVNTAFNGMTQRIDALIHENYEVKLRERENELRALKYQTKPHFLYNALTIIRARALKNGDGEAAQMIQSLSNLQRYVLRGDQNLATVREEINNVADYFELMRAAYEGAIALSVDVEPGVLNAAICKMTLQPLVENCVQHGLASLPQGGAVRIEGRMEDARIRLTVSDNGAGWPEGFSVPDQGPQTESIGLANVRRRMKLTFGDACEFRLFSPPDGGAGVELVFPYRFGAAEPDMRE